MFKKLLSLTLGIVMLIGVSPNTFAAEDCNKVKNETIIYQNNMTDKEHIRQLEDHIKSLNLNKNEYKVKMGDTKIVPFNDISDYKTEYGTKAYPSTSGYAGNQPSRGTKFPTGGGFYYSDKGGPSASISVPFPKPFSNVSFSVDLGNSSTSGIFVDVPNKTDYFKLYVTKKYEVRPYVIYKKQYISEFVGYQWQKYSEGSSKVHISTIASAKRV